MIVQTPKDFARRTNSPPLRGRGRGWGISTAQLDELHKRAAHMRRNPTEPEKRLWYRLNNSQICGTRFRRQQVIGWQIVDFLCAKAKLIVEVDGITHDNEARERWRDGELAKRGYCVIHVTNQDVMTNIDGVVELIALNLSLAASPHPNPSPEGEGLLEVDALKLLGISLEGSVG